MIEVMSEYLMFLVAERCYQASYSTACWRRPAEPWRRYGMSRAAATLVLLLLEETKISLPPLCR
jgi:hypothetical protein